MDSEFIFYAAVFFGSALVRFLLNFILPRALRK